MPKSLSVTKDQAARTAAPPGPSRRRGRWKGVSASHWLQGLLVLVALIPCFLIGSMVSLSGEGHWTRWLDRLNGSLSVGMAARSQSPAVWKGDGIADFGTIKLMDYDPVTRVSTAVQFKMEAVTAFPDRQQFDAFMSRLGHTIQDELLVTVRSSAAAERQDVDYLCKRVVTRVNRLLGHEVLRDVRITDLSIAQFARATEDRTNGP